MNKSKKRATEIVQMEIDEYFKIEREILKAMTVKYLGVKYENFAYQDMKVLLEEELENIEDPTELREKLDKVAYYEDIIEKLIHLKVRLFKFM